MIIFNKSNEYKPVYISNNLNELRHKLETIAHEYANQFEKLEYKFIKPIQKLSYGINMISYPNKIELIQKNKILGYFTNGTEVKNIGEFILIKPLPREFIIYDGMDQLIPEEHTDLMEIICADIHDRNKKDFEELNQIDEN